MAGGWEDMERMRAARRKLAQARQRVRRLSWMARDPDSLDAEVPLLSFAAFLRALSRFQTIRLRQEDATLLLLRLDPCPPSLRRAAAMHLIENTRNCDTLGCAGHDTFLILLKGADEAGARAAAERLHVELRHLAAGQGLLVKLRTRMLPVRDDIHARDILLLLDEAARKQAPRPAAAHPPAALAGNVARL